MALIMFAASLQLLVTSGISPQETGAVSIPHTFGCIHWESPLLSLGIPNIGATRTARQAII